MFAMGVLSKEGRMSTKEQKIKAQQEVLRKWKEDPQGQGEALEAAMFYKNARVRTSGVLFHRMRIAKGMGKR
jgi:hypothetical protein